MKKYLIILLIPLVLFSISYAVSQSLSWKAPTANTDGTPLKDLAGYKVYYGTESGNYTKDVDVGNITDYVAVLPDDGRTYYFAVTAYDISGNESEYSDEISKTTEDKIAPSKPTGCAWRL